MTTQRGTSRRLDRLEFSVSTGRFSDDVLLDGIQTRSLTRAQIQAVFEILGNEIAAQIAVMALSANMQFGEEHLSAAHGKDIRRAIVIMTYNGEEELPAETAQIAARRRLTGRFGADSHTGGHYSGAVRTFWYRDWLHGQLAVHAIGEGEALPARVALDRFFYDTGPFPWPIGWPPADHARRIERFRRAMHVPDDTDLIPHPATRNWVIEQTSPDNTGHIELPDDYPPLGEPIPYPPWLNVVPAGTSTPSPAL